MSVQANIFYPRLAEITGQGPLRLQGSTIRECLVDLVQRFPAAKGLLLDDHGQLLRNIFVHINEESLQQPDLETPVKDGDILLIAALITGGQKANL